MYKKIMIAAMFVSLFGSIACMAQTAKKVTVESKKILIAYYSWSGNTKTAAEIIKNATGGELYVIEPAKAYPKEYKACVDQAKKEINSGFKPELKSQPVDLTKYDVIFVGSPNWWSTIAPPVATFLSKHNFAGKTVIPFVTHGGGGMAKCSTDTAKLCPKANMNPGRAFPGSNIQKSKADIEKWVRDTVTLKK